MRENMLREMVDGGIREWPRGDLADFEFREVVLKFVESGGGFGEEVGARRLGCGK